MPVALLVALAGSLIVHAAALFLPDVDLSTAPPAPPLTAELRPPPPLPAPAVRKPRERPPAAKPHPGHRQSRPAGEAPAAPPAPEPAAAPQPEGRQIQEAKPAPEAVPEAPKALPSREAQEAPATPPQEPHLPSRGYMRFNVYKGDQGLLIGRAEHDWEFADGHYRLFAVTETVGLAALIKPIRIELESRGSLTAEGLQPEHFKTRRNGSDTNENADFDWDAHQLTLGRDGSRHEMADGAQDLLSFHYQFPYLAAPGAGVTMGVATGKKFENYRFDAVGEEYIQTPAGFFRTLHVRVRTDSTTELWLALERQLVPVKIRYTDRKGESFEQVATELGM